MENILQLIRTNIPSNVILAYRLLQGKGYDDWSCFLYLIWGSMKVMRYNYHRRRIRLVHIKFRKNNVVVFLYTYDKNRDRFPAVLITGLLSSRYCPELKNPRDILFDEKGLKILKKTFNKLKEQNIL